MRSGREGLSNEYGKRNYRMSPIRSPIEVCTRKGGGNNSERKTYSRNEIPRQIWGNVSFVERILGTESFEGTEWGRGDVCRAYMQQKKTGYKERRERYSFRLSGGIWCFSIYVSFSPVPLFHLLNSDLSDCSHPPLSVGGRQFHRNGRQK